MTTTIRGNRTIFGPEDVDLEKEGEFFTQSGHVFG